MRRALLYSILSLFTIFIPSCLAVDLSPEFYLGLDAQYRNTRSFTADNIFKSDHPNGNFYLGIKGTEWFGFEIGYQTTPVRTRQSFVEEGYLSMGRSPIFPIEFHRTKSKLSGFHYGVMLYVPAHDVFGDAFNFLFYLGKARLRITYEDIIPLDGNGPFDIFSNTRSFKRRANILKMSTGIQYRLDNLNLRFTIGMEGTSRLKNIRSIETHSTLEGLSFKTSIILGVGANITIP